MALCSFLRSGFVYISKNFSWFHRPNIWLGHGPCPVGMLHCSYSLYSFNLIRNVLISMFLFILVTGAKFSLATNRINYVYGGKYSVSCKFSSSIASKPINICWIRTGSQAYCKIMYSILLYLVFYEYKKNIIIKTSFLCLGLWAWWAKKLVLIV